MSTKSGSQCCAANDGFILISVLISVALLLASATAFAWYARNELRKEETYAFKLEARSAADIACAIIAQRISADENGYDSYIEPLYLQNKSSEINIGDFQVKVSIRPLDDKIPVSGLFLPDGVTLRTEYKNAWNGIWDLLGNPGLAAAALDFMDGDNAQRPGGREGEGNLNRLVTDITEFKLIPEVTEGLLRGTDKTPGLDMYVTVYGKEKINVNVASPEVIAVLDERIGIERARAFAAARMLSPIESLDDLRRVPGFPSAVVTRLANVIGFKSDFFRVDMSVADKFKRERNYRIILERGRDNCVIVRWEE
jgi:type II secretory pathway component PulK